VQPVQAPDNAGSETRAAAAAAVEKSETAAIAANDDSVSCPAAVTEVKEVLEGDLTTKAVAVIDLCVVAV